MKLFYRDAEKQHHHLDAFQQVKECLERVEIAIEQDIISPQNMQCDFFGESLIVNRHEKAIWVHDPDKVNFSNLFRVVLKATAEVIRKQYKKYYDMKVTDEMKKKLDSARTHNIDSEEVMGMFSAIQAKAPCATLLFITSKIKAKKNDTIKFLAYDIQ